MSDSRIRRCTLIILALIMLALTGCANNTKNFSAIDRQRIDSISINLNNVKHIPDKEMIYLNTDAKAWAGFAGGLIGAAIYEANDDHSAEAAIINILNTDDMLKETVAESFRYQFENGGPFKVVPKNEATAYLEIEVMMLQFHEISGDDLRLTGLYFGRLYDANSGAELWSNFEQYIAYNSDLIEYTLDEYISEPAKLRYAVSVISQMLAGDFVEDLHGKRVPINHELHSIESYNNSHLPGDIDKSLVQPITHTAMQVTAPVDTSLDSRLLSLKILYDRGLITKDEYDTKRKQLIEEL